MQRVSQLFWIVLFASACDDASETAEEPQAGSPSQSAGRKKPSEADELSNRLLSCQQQLDAAKTALAGSEVALADAQRADPDADTQRQLIAALAQQRELTQRLEQAEGTLADAQRELTEQDYGAALEELTDLHVLLDKLDAARASSPGLVSLQVSFELQGRPLMLDQWQQTPMGAFRVTGVRYWLSNIALVRRDGTTVELSSTYYLMEAHGAQTLRGGTQKPLTLPAKRRELVELANVPAGDYTAIAFDVGVDAAHNDDLSIPGGELGVLKNMATVEWMWFTSYIFTQLEGWVASTDDDTLDDGGVAPEVQVLWENGTNDDLRRVETRLPVPIRVNLEAHPRIALSLQVDRIWDGLSNQVAAARAASPNYPSSSISVTDPASRTRLADNWRGAFRAVDLGPQ